MNNAKRQLLGKIIRERFDRTEDTVELELLIEISAEMGLTGLAVQMQSDLYHETTVGQWNGKRK